MVTKTALITGVTGQDGAYLSKFYMMSADIDALKQKL